MKIITFEVSLSIGWADTRSEKLEIFVDENATDEEIEEAKQQASKDWAWKYIDLCWN